jgi:predicted PurR-regulated permease PerM
VGTVTPPATRYEIIAWVLAGLALSLILVVHLLPALLAGLLAYELVHLIARRLRLVQLGGHGAKVVAVGLLGVIVVTLLTLAVLGVIAFFRSDLGNIGTLLAKMADILDSARDKLPPWLAGRLPENAADLRIDITDWLREHSGEVQTIGKEAGRAFAHILVGLVIGAMVSLREVRDVNALGSLARALAERADRLGNAFRRIVFAQIRISALNTTLTTIYLVAVLPMLGIRLPLVKTMIAVTFIAGLLPVLGNLISNTVIVIVSLSFSLGAAAGSLAFLVLIHKLEYFVNARIVGTQIRAAAWELLLAMLSMEAAFGVPGLIAAPVYYAYLKDELSSRRLL